MLINKPGHANGFEQGDPCNDGDLEMSNLFGEDLKETQVINRVGKEEINPQTYLLFHVHDLQIEDMTFHSGIDLGAHTKLGLSLEIVAHEVIALLEALGCVEQAHHIEVKDGLRFEMISNGGGVALKE